MTENSSSTDTRTSKRTLWFIYNSVQSFPVAFSFMFIVAIVSAIDISLRPYILKIIINKVSLSSQNIFSNIAFPILSYVGIIIFITTIFRIYSYVIDIKMIPVMRQNIANYAFDCLLRQHYDFYQNNSAGSLTNKINDLINSVPEIIQIFINRFFSHILALIVAMYTLLQVNISFALIMLTWVGIFSITAYLYSVKLHNFSREWSELNSSITGKVNDVLLNILSVKLFSQQANEQKSFNKLLGLSIVAEQKVQWVYFWIWFIYGYSFSLMQLVSFYFLIKGMQQNNLTIGDFALVLGLNISITDFMGQLTRDVSQFSMHLGKVTQALNTLLVKQENKYYLGSKTAFNKVITRGEIIFDNVEFSYKGSDPLFQNKTITIGPGQKVGLVGYSGSGKTTFINLLLRLFDIRSGSILIDGINIYDISLESLRQAVTVIPQDQLLFARSIRENISYGLPNATYEEIIKAAKYANAHQFITKLPEGYDTIVGERGSKISSGEGQRIIIARAFLKNSPILILDEATSQLDTINEDEIEQSLKVLMEGKTTIVIAHRLKTLLHMDRILVFNQGKIVQDGKHAKLASVEGLYKNLLNQYY